MCPLFLNIEVVKAALPVSVSIVKFNGDSGVVQVRLEKFQLVSLVHPAGQSKCHWHGTLIVWDCQ